MSEPDLSATHQLVPISLVFVGMFSVNKNNFSSRRVIAEVYFSKKKKAEVLGTRSTAVGLGDGSLQSLHLRCPWQSNGDPTKLHFQETCVSYSLPAATRVAHLKAHDTMRMNKLAMGESVLVLFIWPPLYSLSRKLVRQLPYCLSSQNTMQFTKYNTSNPNKAAWICLTVS